MNTEKRAGAQEEFDSGRLASQMSRTPESPAKMSVVFALRRSTTYRRIATYSKQVAHFLRQRRIAPRTSRASRLPRSNRKEIPGNGIGAPTRTFFFLRDCELQNGASSRVPRIRRYREDSRNPLDRRGPKLPGAPVCDLGGDRTGGRSDVRERRDVNPSRHRPEGNAL